MSIFFYTNHYINNRFQELFKRFKITQQQFNILRILRGHHPSSANVGIVKERMLDKSSDVTRLIERLRTKKLLQRKVCKKDRRKIDVKITEEGLALLSEIDVQEQKMDILLSGLNSEEMIQLNSLLDKVREGN
ncbi:MAG: MarR family transcriptional regulator [Flavobacteriaceae bacterium]|nr:MarR family transcriptional regulator [Flavobacteriaceae bacterium]